MWRRQLTKMLAQRGRKSAYKVVFMQAMMASIISILFFTLLGEGSGYSALAGGIIAVLPNFVFATLAFSHMGASATAKVIKTFYWGEAVKLLLTITLFSLVFVSMKVAFMPLFVCYTLTLMMHGAAALYCKQC